MTEAVSRAVEEIRAHFPEYPIEVLPEAQGGAFIILQNVDIGRAWDPSRSWVGFLIDYLYDRSDVYPHFIDGSVRRVDGSPHVAPVSGPVQWQNRNALQVSRKSNHLLGGLDTAAMKLEKVLEWLRTR